jgi:hypothetical protein
VEIIQEKNIAASDFDNCHKIFSKACIGINHSHRCTERYVNIQNVLYKY